MVPHSIILQKRQEKLLEKRKVIGGNLYCENQEGIFIYKYGPHIFHTDNKKVWDFVNSLTHFNPYIQQTVAKVDNKLYSFTFQYVDL